MGFMGCDDTFDPYEPYISALATDGTNIFAAGGFAGGYQTNGTFVPSHWIIKWDGTNWIQMGMNETPIYSTYTGLFGLATNSLTELGIEPSSICIAGTNLFVVGPFQYPHNDIARFSTVNGNYIACDDLLLNGNRALPGGVNFPELALVAKDDVVYLTGDFDHVGSVAASGIACWNNGSWSALGPA